MQSSTRERYTSRLESMVIPDRRTLVSMSSMCVCSTCIRFGATDGAVPSAREGCVEGRLFDVSLLDMDVVRLAIAHPAVIHWVHGCSDVRFGGLEKLVETISIK